MQKWLSRLRGTIGIRITWAAAWFGAGVILLFIVGFGAADVPFPRFFGLLGFLAGAAFSVILSAFGSRWRFDQRSLPRFAGWGALGGALLAGIFPSSPASAESSGRWGPHLVWLAAFPRPERSDSRDEPKHTS